MRLGAYSMPLRENSWLKGPFVENGKHAEAREKVMKWWKEYQSKGEKQMLIEGTESADPDSIRQAEMLAKRYPDAAVPPIRLALKKFTDTEDRYEMIQVLQHAKGKEAEEFLREQLNAKDRSSRFSAAEVLWKRCKSREAVAVVIKDWKAIQAELGDDDSSSRRHHRFMMWFLAASRDAEAIRELTATLKNQTHSLHNGILEQIARETGNDPLPKDAQTEMEKLLIVGLSITSEADDFGRVNGGTCGVDWATYGLGRLWKISPALDQEATFRTRERQRAIVQNEWRKRQQMPPIPFAEFPKSSPLPRKIIDPLLREFIDEKTDDGRAAVAAKIRLLGAGALPKIYEAIRDLNKSHPARDALQLLAGRMSFAVSEIRMLEGSIEPFSRRKHAGYWTNGSARR